MRLHPSHVAALQNQLQAQEFIFLIVTPKVSTKCHRESVSHFITSPFPANILEKLKLRSNLPYNVLVNRVKTGALVGAKPPRTAATFLH